MKSKIFRVLFLSILLAILTTFAGMVFLTAKMNAAAAKTELAQYSTRLAAQLSTTSHPLLEKSATLAQETWVEAATVAGYRVTLIKADGTVLYDNKVPVAEIPRLENHATREEILAAAKTGQGRAERTSATLDEQTFYYAVKLPAGDFVRLSVTTLTAWGLKGQFWAYGVGLLLLGIVLSRWVANALARRIVAPVNALDVDDPRHETVYPELTPLVDRMQAQRDKIQAQIQQIKEQNRALRTIARGMSEGLVILDPEGKVLSINASALAILGQDESSALQSPLVIPFPGFSAADGWDFARFAKDDCREVSREVTLPGASGAPDTEKTYRFSLTRVSNKNRLIGYALFIIDMTLAKAAERQRREFTANVSHELKTPLQSIIGAAELLENGLVKPDDVGGFATRIRQEGDRLVALVNDLIFLSRLDEGSDGAMGAPHRPEEARSLKAIMGDIWERLAPEAEKKGVRLILEGEDLGTTVHGRYLYELLRNLCDNAVKYHTAEKPDRFVAVRFRRSAGENVEITVEDNGPGIPAADLEHIFERFYRGQESRLRRIEGTGLGLSIVKRVALFFHGQVTVESTPGVGTTFHVVLPERALFG